MRTCSKCKQVKDESDFLKWKFAKDGSNLTYYCKACEYARVADYQQRNKQACNERKNNWAKQNKARRLAQSSAYMKRNRPYYAAKQMQYNADNLQRTPKWLTEDDHWMMEEAYQLAKLREQIVGGKWHVDHIVPLRGKNVAGFHVPWNLQVIPARDNQRKSNRHAI